MAKYEKKCGPDAIDYYDDYGMWNNTYSRTHDIKGTGCIDSNNAKFGYKNRYEDSYYIKEGITELGDNCFNNSSITSVTLPSTLTVIGNHCFEGSRIKSINLPEELESIGHYNFPSSLLSIKIPKKINNLPIDNFIGCRDLCTIIVDDNNDYYNEKDGILYNHDMTEILFCPNAKEGIVVIPNTVTRIGDYCFANCKKLETIIIPLSVTEVGDYAFQNAVIKRLSIKSSVKSIGIGCFAKAKITESFKFSQQVKSLPDNSFDSFNCPQKLNFINRLENIGENAFHAISELVLPEKISLQNVKEIRTGAFSSIKGDLHIELFSTLQKLGKSIFDGVKGTLAVRYFSYAPLNINDDTWGDIGENSLLIVPEGTKMIFENASAWGSFPKIEEWNIGVDKKDEDFISVLDEVFYTRLKSIAESKIKANRFFLKDIISDLAQTYQYVDTEEEYNESKCLLAYNRGFSPVVVPNLEGILYREWPTGYKLKILNDTLTGMHASQIFISENEEECNSPKEDILNLSLQKPIEIESKQNPVVAYFNEEILTQLQNHLALSRSSVKIAVSWFTNYSLFQQIKQLANDGVKIQLITNNDLVNNGGYCLDLNDLIDSGVEISLVEYPHLIHHKFVIIDDSFLITGSYNWTRFSSKNYENIVVLTDEMIIEEFNSEFDNLLEKAEHKKITKMPECAKERPEYDRSAFKQYITEELDSQAKESSDERDKITALKKAVDLNPTYLEKINPGIQKKYSEAFKIVDNKENVQRVIVNTIQKTVAAKKQESCEITVDIKDVKSDVMGTPDPSALTQEQFDAIKGIKASGLIMAIDVSGSMSQTFIDGHVHDISKKALSAALALTDDQAVTIWTFGDEATFKGQYDLRQISEIDKIACEKRGTNLRRFIDKANSSIKDGALCIIFTDDDAKSISAAIDGMRQRENVFWQIIVYQKDVKNIKTAIENTKNTSVVVLSDYKSKTDDEISEMLLNDYIVWKSKK